MENKYNFSGMREENGFFSEGSSRIPEIDFNLHSGEFVLRGKSIPENAAKVYEPLLEVIARYVKSPRAVTNFRLNLEYFNSASLIWFAKIARALSRAEREDSVLFIHIYLDIEDYESMELDEIKDVVCSLVDNIGKAKVSVGIKIYGINDKNKVLKETTILT